MKINEPTPTDTVIQSLARMQAYYENIISALPCYVYWKDRDFAYRGCNDLVAKLLHLPSKQSVVGKTDYDFGWTGELVNTYRAIDTDIISTGKAVSVEEKLVHDGNIIYLLVNKTPLVNEHNEVIGILGISVDITEQKRIEERLTQAKKDADQANQAKTEFIANMSHDIRTPLTGIIGLSHMLEEGVDSPDHKLNARYLHEAGQQLLDLCNGILDVVSASHFTEEDVHAHSFDLRQMIDSLVQIELPTIRMKGLELKIEIDPAIPHYLISDRVKLNRILLNLLGNAIRFTEKGYIRLTVTLLNQMDEKLTLHFCIEDTGLGIPKALQDKVFDRFFMVSPSYKGGDNSYSRGIGLHIAQKYIQLLKGDISLDSDEGKGSTFFFDLAMKVAELEEEDTPLIESVEDNAHLPYILLVEDNFIALRVLEGLVKAVGCHFLSVNNGEEALMQVTSNTFDLIITDIGLPSISGIELTTKIRAWERTYNKNAIPIVGLTGHAIEQFGAECFEVGMNKLLQKPASKKDLKILLLELGFVAAIPALKKQSVKQRVIDDY